MNNFYYNNYCLDEIESNGDTIRRKNQVKMKSMLSMAVSFIDPDTLAKIKNVIHSMDPEQMETFKEFLENREYLKRGKKDPKSKEIINQIAKVALTSVPKDKTLKKYYVEYNDNLKKIDKIKKAMSEVTDEEVLNELFAYLSHYNERNVEIMAEIDLYRQKVFK